MHSVFMKNMPINKNTKSNIIIYNILNFANAIIT